MRSKLAEQLRQEQREKFAAMTPSERVALADRLGREWLANAIANGSTREEALRTVRRSRRAGRRPSAVMDGRDDS